MSSSSSSSSSSSDSQRSPGDSSRKSQNTNGKRNNRQSGGKHSALEEELKNLRAQLSAPAVAERERQQQRKDQELLERDEQRRFESAIRPVPDLENLSRYESVAAIRETLKWVWWRVLLSLLLCFVGVILSLIHPAFLVVVVVSAVGLYYSHAEQRERRVQSYKYVVGDELAAPLGASNSVRFAKLELAHKDPRVYEVDYVRKGFVIEERADKKPKRVWRTTHTNMYVSAALVAEVCDKFMARPWSLDSFAVVMDDIVTNSSINIPLDCLTVRQDTLLYVRDYIMKRQAELSGSRRLQKDGVIVSHMNDSSFLACPLNL